MTRQKITLALLTLTLLTTAIQAEDLLAEKPIQKSNLSLQLPKNWQPDDHTSPNTLLLARAPDRDKDDTGEFQTVLTLSAEPGAKIDGQAQQARVAKQFANYNYKPTEDPQPITFNGIEGVKFGGTLTIGPLKLRTRQYILLHDSHLYTLTFMSLDSLWSTYAPAIEACAATLNIAPQK